MGLIGGLLFFVFVVCYIIFVQNAVDSVELVRHLKLSQGIDNKPGFPSFTGFFQGETYKIGLDTYLRRNKNQRFTSVEFPVNNPTGLSFEMEVPRFDRVGTYSFPFITRPDGTKEEDKINEDEFIRKDKAIKDKTDIQTGDGSFNEKFFVGGNNKDAVASVLSQDITRQMMALDGMKHRVTGHGDTKHYFDLYLNGDTLLYKRYGQTLEGPFYEQVLTMMHSVAMAVEALK